jgi:hypothetical protein
VSLASEKSDAAERSKRNMSYGEVRDFLAKHTKLVELCDDKGARVAVAPEWQGRVMTSTCGGLEGLSFGFVNRELIASGKTDPHINGCGAEDRFWLSPEGGPYSLWFKPGVKQTLADWYTPKAIDTAAWNVVSKPGDSVLRMAMRMKFQNASATDFDLDATRDVRLLGAEDLRELLGESAAALMAQSGVKTVAYESINAITNRGADLSKEKGLVSIWVLGMMNSGPKTVVVVPYKPGGESELGPVVQSDYFGTVPAARLKVAPEAVLFSGDSEYRSKIGISQRRARNVLGSIDFESGVLTLVHFNMPEDPSKHDYMNNKWEVPQARPYRGDVVNSYNDGPNESGNRFGAFYEIETLSPARELKTGESLAHRSRTIHIQADAETLQKLAKEILGVDLQSVRAAMLAQ